MHAINEIDKEKELKIVQNLICNNQCLTNVLNRIHNTDTMSKPLYGKEKKTYLVLCSQ